MVARVASHLLDPDEHTHKALLCAAYRGRGPILHLAFRDLEVDRADVGPLREALEGCSPDELLAAVLRHEAGWRMRADALESRARAMLVRKVTDALDAMVEAPSGASCAERGQVVGPLWRLVVNGSGHCLEYSVGAALYARENSGAVRELLRTGAERARTWDELRDLRDRLEGRCALDAVGMPAFEGSIAHLSRLPWDEALALPLWLPKGLSEQERYAVLARAFWAMTYHGFTREERERSGVDERRGGSVREPRIALEPWSSDPARAMLEHACWIDALEMHDALFTMLPSSGNTPVTEARAR